MSNYFAFKSIRVVALGSALLFLAGFSPAQVSSGPQPLADPNDHRFEGVHEDWTTPALTSSHLMPARPLEFINDYPHYTMELLRVQWRWGDPIDLYVMKPKGVKKPPVILISLWLSDRTRTFSKTTLTRSW